MTAPGEIVRFSDELQIAESAAVRLARALRDALGRRGRASIALSGGNTPRPAYALLAREPGIDWAKTHVFWVDERAVPPDSDRSNYRWAKATLLDHAGVPAECVHRMPAERDDLDTAAVDYEREIRARVQAGSDGLPVFDVMVLGIGDDGHTASLFPGEMTVDVVDRLVLAVPPRPPTHEARLTLSAPIIQRAHDVVLIVTGATKRSALTRVWAADGDVHETPARIVRNCRGTVTWIVDEAVSGATNRE